VRMKLEIVQFDVAAQIQGGQDPNVFVRRYVVNPENNQNFAIAQVADGARWMIRQPDSTWSLDESSSEVRIPLTPYQLKSSNIESLVQFGFELGATYTSWLNEPGLQEVLQGKQPTKLFVAVGNVFQLPAPPHTLQCWLGAAFKLD
jgi:hypothetical protein